ncbi:MAG: M20 family metallopeptidase, partial [Candidatus Muirbacterium halophilum]|nr:M20 family metallopeptidase [Candidatus Muirbacterium halophilum]
AMKEIKKVIKKTNPKSKVVINKKHSPSLEHEYNPYVCENNEMFEKFKQCIPKDVKYAHCDLTTRSVGDFNFFGTRAKIPVLVFGPGGGNIHSPNEFVNKDEIIKTTDYLLDYFMKIM